MRKFPLLPVRAEILIIHRIYSKYSKLSCLNRGNNDPGLNKVPESPNKSQKQDRKKVQLFPVNLTTFLNRPQDNQKYNITSMEHCEIHDMCNIIKFNRHSESQVNNQLGGGDKNGHRWY